MEPLTVFRTLDSLRTIAAYVKQVAAVACLDQKASYNLRLAVDEIVTNIIVYGCQHPNHEEIINLRVRIDEENLTLSIEDTCAAFHPFEKLNVLEEQIHLPMEQQPIGGLGLYLAIHSVDEFLYERVGDRNLNILVVRLPKKGT